MSADVEAVIRLLERWRDASGMSRMTVGLEATRTINALSPERKRALAIEVAERVAPQLVPAIRSESGDLTTEQVGALVDLIRRADREQLDALVTALRTGDVAGALDEGLDLVDEAVDVLAPPDLEADDVADAEGTPGPRRVTRGSAAAAATAGATAGAAPSTTLDDDEVEVAADGSLELDEEAVRERLRAEAAERAARYRDTSRDAPATPVYKAPDLDFTTDLDLPDPTVEEAAPLEERLDDLPGRRRGVPQHPVVATTEPRTTRTRHELPTGPVTAVVAAITATPDGYRRRRAALAAIREQRLDGEDVAAVVHSFRRDTDRAWVAGAALDAGLVDGGDLRTMALTPGATRRLRARVD